ncbi:MAG: SPOR domain-containing protein [Prevotella sp.]|uniref:SPOR domain-containing protein n=1 Tax=Prevotella sp. TaxID=59823 RepID=UPI002A2B2918|nr:SPOR domain-containing protein [Prevotella sp.]MDD7317931.1 SPOR domain-containing protein [Prevotellaceae bacterium]MDY4020822.1 SPOR domain-containing protein [Prevotella sp.]
MRQLILAMILAIAGITTAGAQTFLKHLQQRQQGQGTVTVNESAQIDSLVNNILPTLPEKKTEQQSGKGSEAKADKVKNDPGKNEEENRETAGNDTDRTKTEPRRHEPETSENVVVDTRKKVMANAHRTTGYRVQVYRGGGTRDAKQKAQSVGNQVKTKFPGQPVYVHFYSPNWTVRIGNFKSQDEAIKVLRQVKKAGFGGATLVRGPITVSR